MTMIHFYTSILRSHSTHHHDYSEDIISFFTNYQSSCAILSATSVLGLVKMSNYKYKNSVARMLHGLGQICFFSSIMLFLLAITISTSAQTVVLQGQFKPSGQNANEVLMREYEFETTSLICSFHIALLYLFNGVISTLLIPSNENQNKMIVIILVVMAEVCVLSGILSYLNTHLYTWANCFDMMRSLANVSSFSLYLCVIFQAKIDSQTNKTC